MKKVAILIAFLSLTLLFSGCWDYSEIDEKMIVAGISIDKSDGSGLLISFEMLPMPTGSQSPIEPIVVTAEGATLEEAIGNVTEKIAYFPYVGHSWLILVSEEYAREGLFELVETLVRNPDFYMCTYVGVVKDAKAFEAFDCKETATMILSYDLMNGLEADQKYVGKTNTLYVYEIFSVMQETSDSCILPSIEIRTEGDSEFAVVSGGAIFRGDQCIDFISVDEVQAYQIATGAINSSSLVVNINGRDLTVKIMKNESSVEVDISGNVPTIYFHVELTVSSENHPDIESARYMEGTEKKVKERIGLLVNKAKEQNCDIFGIATILRRHYPAVWDQLELEWSTLFTQLDYEILVDVTVTN